MQSLRLTTLLLSLTLLAGMAAGQAVAQQKAPAKAAEKAPPAQAGGIPMADAYKLNLLIRTSIIALNQANQTGNYTVLQDLGSPAFRASNNSARLAQIFAELRAKNRDLSPVLFYKPQLLAVPQVNEQGILRLVGYFETEPERVNFDLYFQLIGQDWRIFGIGVSTTPIAGITGALNSQPQQAPGPGASAQSQQKAGNRQAAAQPAPDGAEKPSASERQQPAPPPSRKPVAAKPVEAGSKAEESVAVEAIVKNQTTNNVARARIDLQSPDINDDAPLAEAPAAAAEDQAEPTEEGFWSTLNPFSSN